MAKLRALIQLRRAVTRLTNARISYRLCRGDEGAKKALRLAEASYGRVLIRLERLLVERNELLQDRQNRR